MTMNKPQKFRKLGLFQKILLMLILVVGLGLTLWGAQGSSNNRTTKQVMQNQQVNHATREKLNYQVHEKKADNGTQMWNVEIKQAKLGVGFAQDSLAPGKVTLETPSHFAQRHNLPLVINASRYNLGKNEMWGTHLHQGRIIAHQRFDSYSSYLTIANDGKTLGSQPNWTVFRNGQFQEVLAGFFPLIQHGRSVAQPRNLTVASMQHPRQIIYQLKNGDFGILSIAGRFDGNQGLDYQEMLHELAKIKHIQFAYNLDGGGSTSTVVQGQMINPSFDKSRKERRVRDYIYFYPDGQQDPLEDQ